MLNVTMLHRRGMVVFDGMVCKGTAVVAAHSYPGSEADSATNRIDTTAD